jgi:predicted TPR repeat methyltransferase
VENKTQLPTELELDDALALAVRMHRHGELDTAETLYRRILEASPGHPGALHFLGVLLHHRGQSEQAIDLIRRSIELDPDEPGRYNNLGNVLLECQRLAEAAEAYQQAIALGPDHADAWNNLGALYRALGRVADAGLAYQKAIEIDPEHVDAYNNLGNLLSSQGRISEAVAYYCKAITLVPSHPQSRRLLGIAYYTLGQIEAAAKVFRDWLEAEPDNPIARHLFAACSRENVPARASDAYIETTFDDFAASFDAKLERLDYRAPRLIADALARACGAPAKQFACLDAGCGTGLCGPLIAPWVHRLAGVDLSARMLAEARNRGVYDELVKGELTACLDAHPGAFDLVVSADTLVYFGDLEPVIGSAFRALRADGWFLFTVEEAAGADDAGGYRINPHGRYAHSRAYVKQTLRTGGFAPLTLEPVILRLEGGSPVSGLLVTARRTA